MKVLVTGDWHIGVTSFGVIDKHGRNSRLLDVAGTIEKICDIALDEKVDHFIHCGDIFHTNRPTTAEQLIFLKFLKFMEREQIDTSIIIGNHDYNSQLGKGHALKLFKQLGFDCISIYDKTEAVIYDDVRFIFYPFAGEDPDITNIVSQSSVKRNVLVCHSHLEGAVVGAEPFEIKDDKATKFRDLPVDAVFAGHFHKPQVLSEKPLAFYPGSIQPVDFNERADVKGVVIVDIDDMSHRPVSFETRRLVQCDLDNAGMPSHDDGFRDAIVKVNVELPESEAHKFDECAIREHLEKEGAHSIASINLTVLRDDVKRDPGIKIDSNVKSNFIRFLKQKDYGDLQDRIEEIGCSIIDECGAE